MYDATKYKILPQSMMVKMVKSLSSAFIYGIVICQSFAITAFADTTPQINFEDKIFSKLSDEQKQLIAEYQTSYFLLRNYYENSTISVQSKSYFMTDSEGSPLPSGTPPILKRIKELEYRSNSNDGKKPYLRMDKTITFVDGEKFEKENKEGFLVKEIGILTPDKGYLLEKNDKDAQYFSLLAVRDANNVLYHAGIFDNAAYAYGGTPLENLVFKRPAYPNIDEYIIDSITPIMEGDDSLIEIIIHATGKTTSQNVMWKIKLLRNQSWAVKEMFYQGITSIGEKWWLKSVCSYNKDTKSQCPQLADLVVERGRYNQDIMYTTQKDEYFVKDFIPGAVPISEFDAAQFLSPGTKIRTATSLFSTPQLVCLFSGLSLIGISLLLLKIRKTKAR